MSNLTQFTEGGAIKASELNNNFDKLGVDYIVEQGFTNGWYYRKWNSGIAECWGIHTVTIGGTATVGSLYCGYGSLYFPFSFSVRPTVTYSANVTTGYDWCGKAIIELGHFNFYLISASSFTTSATPEIRAHVIGKWK